MICLAKRKVQPVFEEKEDWGVSILHNSSKDRDRLYKKFDEYQRTYLDSINNYPVIMVDQPSGTGKTTIAVMAALDKLRAGSVGKISYIRFPDNRYGKLGYMPGTKAEKEAILMRPFYEACEECGVQKDVINRLIEMDLIELSTDICYRGCNVRDSFMIIDEAQNSTIEDMKLMLTRIHDKGSFTTIIGHSAQTDLKNVKTYGIDKLNAFEVYQIHMRKRSFTKICYLPTNYRGEISKWADNVSETIKEIEDMC